MYIQSMLVYCLIGCDAMRSGRSLLTFWREQTASIFQVKEDSDHGGSTLIQTLFNNLPNYVASHPTRQYLHSHHFVNLKYCKSSPICFSKIHFNIVFPSKSMSPKWSPDFLTKILYAFQISPIPTYTTSLTFLDYMTLTISGEVYKLWSSSTS
jgi:hypothetical protein